MSYCIIQGDCLEIMRGLEAGSVDHIITDPPFNQQAHDYALTFRRGIAYDDAKKGIDEFKPMENHGLYFAEFLRITRRWGMAFCTLDEIKIWYDLAWEQSAWVRAGVWDRVNPAPQFSGDRPSQAVDGIAIWHNPKQRKKWNGGGKPGIWRYPVERDKIHPTQKPLALMRKLVSDFTDPGDFVLDPFMGSGTTGVACLELGRNFIGIELINKYCELAEKRLAQAEKQMALPGVF